MKSSSAFQLKSVTLPTPKVAPSSAFSIIASMLMGWRTPERSRLRKKTLKATVST